MNDVLLGVRSAYGRLAEDVKRQYGAEITRLRAMGVSAMMHGYLALDAEGNLLAPFRTWRNLVTREASERLTRAFGVSVPQRFSVAHLYQAVLDSSAHVPKIASVTTLAGYVHGLLTGRRAAGICDASGMFPVDWGAMDYDAEMVKIFDGLLRDAGVQYAMRDVFPPVLAAGEDGGALTQAGARLLDASGALEPGVPLCPPEGDAGTGMVASNSVRAHTVQVSAGTSVFASVALDHPLKTSRAGIDQLAAPDGRPVALVQCNTCTSDLNAWIGLLGEAARLLGALDAGASQYELLLREALSGDADCGGIVGFNCFSGEPVLGLETGCPMVLRDPGRPMRLANFLRQQVYACFASLRIGMDALGEAEGVTFDAINAHGGLFKTKGVAQGILAAALKAPVAVSSAAENGGAWGAALLAAYRGLGKGASCLADFLDGCALMSESVGVAAPDEACAAGFDAYLRRYVVCLSAQREGARAIRQSGEAVEPSPRGGREG